MTLLGEPCRSCCASAPHRVFPDIAWSPPEETSDQPKWNFRAY
jgi:hypothetical protein